MEYQKEQESLNKSNVDHALDESSIMNSSTLKRSNQTKSRVEIGAVDEEEEAADDDY